MPAMSKKQQKFFQIALGIKRGKISASYSPEAAKIAETVPDDEIKKFTKIQKNEDYDTRHSLQPYWSEHHSYKPTKVQKVRTIISPFGVKYRVTKYGGIIPLKKQRRVDVAKSIFDVLEKAKQGLKYGWSTTRKQAFGLARVQTRTISGPKGKFSISQSVPPAKGSKIGPLPAKLARFYADTTKEPHNTPLDHETSVMDAGSRAKQEGRKLYRKLEFSKKSLTKAQQDELYFRDIEERVSEAFRRWYNPHEFNNQQIAPAPIEPAKPYWHVEKTASDHIIVQQGYSGNIYQHIPYKLESDGSIKFGKPKNVKLAFVVSKAGEILGRTFKKAVSLGSQYRTIAPRVFGSNFKKTRLISGPSGFHMIQRLPAGKRRYIAGRGDDSNTNTITTSNREGRFIGRYLHRKVGLSQKALPFKTLRGLVPVGHPNNPKMMHARFRDIGGVGGDKPKFTIARFSHIGEKPSSKDFRVIYSPKVGVRTQQIISGKKDRKTKSEISRNLYEKVKHKSMKFSKKSLIKAAKKKPMQDTSSVPTSYDALSSTTGYSH